jgi:hypothetical protein
MLRYKKRMDTQHIEKCGPGLEADTAFNRTESTTP